MGLVARTFRTSLYKDSRLVPLVFSVSKDFPSLTNPSIFVDADGRVYCLIRNVNYVLWHSEYRQKFSLDWGTLSYLHPENDSRLATQNWFCTLDENYQVKAAEKIDTHLLDTPPVWNFHGLEDARLVKWNGTFVAIGVRRDTKPDGEGRMELSTLRVSKEAVSEVVRVRTKYEHAGYCEKNWMPILDMPYHFIRWADPLEIVKVDPTTGECQPVIKLTTEDRVPTLRGSSQVVRVGAYRVCIVHEVDLTPTVSGRKNGIYTHRFVVWDEDWKLVHLSESFNFLDNRIEFCCGLAIKDDNMLISFGAQDNSAFLYVLPVSYLLNSID